MSEPMNITELVIDRAKWGKGALLNSEGKMCCLGFLSKACGVPDEEIKYVPFPHTNWDKIPTAFRGNTPACSKAAAINDEYTQEPQTPEEREAALISLFSEKGIALRFTGTSTDTAVPAHPPVL